MNNGFSSMLYQKINISIITLRLNHLYLFHFHSLKLSLMCPRSIFAIETIYLWLFLIPSLYVTSSHLHGSITPIMHLAL